MAYAGSKILSFCSVSECTRHDPAAIWAHIEPVIHYVKEDIPDVHHIDFWSDGPTSQYRNKQHFLCISHIEAFGLKSCTWNFFEAGHGKGAADGIGGVVKRSADRSTNEGTEVQSAQAFVDELTKRTKVKMFLITEDDISSKDTFISGFGALKPIPGTMKLHQAVTKRTQSCV